MDLILDWIESHFDLFPYSQIIFVTIGWTVFLFIGIRLSILFFAYLWRLWVWSRFEWKGGPGQWAVVVGATGQIGAEYAKNLLAKDYNLLLISNKAEKLEVLKQELLTEADMMREVRTHVMDLRSDDDQMYAELDAVIDGLGGHLDVWVNAFSAKYPRGRPNYYTMLQDAVIEDMITVNVCALTRFLDMALRRMVERRRGVVVNLSSFSAIYPTPLLTLFSASKAYVDYLSRAVHEEYCKDGVIVQSILPYNVTTSKKRKTWECTPEHFVRKAMGTVGMYKRTTVTYGMMWLRGWVWELNNWNKIFLKDLNVRANYHHAKKLMRPKREDLEALLI